MEWLLIGASIGILVAALRDEFRSGGSLSLSGLVEDVPAGHPDFAYRDPIGTPSPWVIVSPQGVEIPVGALSAAEIVAVLADIDRVDELGAAA